MTLFSARSGRRQRLGLVVLVALATVVPGGPAAADDPSATALGDGWWNRLQGAQEGEPEANPLRPLVPPVPAPPNVPGTAIVAGTSAGQPDKVAAVAVEVRLPAGSGVEALTLRLTESAVSGANVNHTAAKVLACPAVAPWGPAKNAAWVDRPEADCTSAPSQGARAGDGTWTFDLTAMARAWTDPFAPLAQNGVVLSVDPAASGGPVQVAWNDLDSGGVVVELAATPVPAGAGPDPTAAPPAPPVTAGPPFEPSSAAGSAPSAVFPAVFPAALRDPVAFASRPPRFTSPPPSPGAVPSPAVPSPAVPEDVIGSTTLVASPPATLATATLPTTLRLRPAVGFWDSVPSPTLLLLPVALGLALLVGLTLGPLGRPLPVFARAGGLSRALGRRNGPDAPS